MELMIKPIFQKYIIKEDNYYNEEIEKLEIEDLQISDLSDDYSTGSSGSSGSSSSSVSLSDDNNIDVVSSQKS